MGGGLRDSGRGVMTGRANEPAHPLLTIGELAEIVGVNPSTLYRAITREDFPVPIVRFGDRIRVPRAAVEALIYGDDRGDASSDSSDRSEGYSSSCATRRRLASCSAGRKSRTPGARP